MTSNTSAPAHALRASLNPNHTNPLRPRTPSKLDQFHSQGQNPNPQKPKGRVSPKTQHAAPIGNPPKHEKNPANPKNKANKSIPSERMTSNTSAPAHALRASLNPNHTNPLRPRTPSKLDQFHSQGQNSAHQKPKGRVRGWIQRRWGVRTMSIFGGATRKIRAQRALPPCWKAQA
ncbi:hypothetical protein CFELI_02945 [Corynebacterium felinum]|uniref:Uncharacterized protein n=1 Tax=Corynebacterium felinum TaxID=131318 RepID=A0ABU2B8D8_9CORY|nr:hypothetical protein [Corynebacterium felinum]WJY94231.1 hypothetical protein CFELI_02945 [Corynebacterium felinum]